MPGAPRQLVGGSSAQEILAHFDAAGWRRPVQVGLAHRGLVHLGLLVCRHCRNLLLSIRADIKATTGDGLVA